MPNESFLRPMRASMLAKTLSDRNIPFTIFTSNFNHSLKKFRFKTFRPGFEKIIFSILTLLVIHVTFPFSDLSIMLRCP